MSFMPYLSMSVSSLSLLKNKNKIRRVYIFQQSVGGCSQLCVISLKSSRALQCSSSDPEDKSSFFLVNLKSGSSAVSWPNSPSELRMFQLPDKKALINLRGLASRGLQDAAVPCRHYPVVGWEVLGKAAEMAATGVHSRNTDSAGCDPDCLCQAFTAQLKE